MHHYCTICRDKTKATQNLILLQDKMIQMSYFYIDNIGAQYEYKANYTLCNLFKRQLKWQRNDNFLLCCIKLKYIWKIESGTA
jgi:hypothetical protein